MTVILSVGGKFQAFHLAEQLAKRGYLKQLITTWFDRSGNARGMKVPDDKISTYVFPELLMRLPAKIPYIRKHFNGAYHKATCFDNWASTRLQPADIFIGWSSFSLKCLARARYLGAKTILERCSTHMGFQCNILQEEYEMHGFRFPINRPLLERELAEYAEADYIALPSSFALRTFVERGFPRKRLLLLPFGVDLEEFHAERKLDDVFRVVFMANNSLRKGLHYLLQAFHELKLKSSELVVAGHVEDEMIPFLKKYRHDYRHIGTVPFQDLHKVYSQSSVMVLPSLEEGMALVIPQAMACGIPVICTANSGGEDILRDGEDGFIIPIRSVDSIKEKLLQLYADRELLCRMGQSAMNRVNRHFTWDNYGDHNVESFKAILI